MTDTIDSAPVYANIVDTPADTPDARLTFALANAQAEFPVIEKAHTAKVVGKDGKGGYSYTYADLADVLAAVRPVLSRNGLALVQRTQIDANGQVLLLTELRHIGGGVLSSEINLSHPTNNPQQFGGALTYLRRYGLVTLLGIAAEEDRDAQNVEPTRATPVTPKRVEPDQVSEAVAEFLNTTIAETGIDGEVLRRELIALGVPNVPATVTRGTIRHLTAEQAKALGARLAEIEKEKAS